jgi:hypothetical protein
MAYFELGGSPAYSTFRANFGLGQTALSDIRARVYPYNLNAMSSYRNGAVWRYLLTSNPGLRVRFISPYTSDWSAFGGGYYTPWFLSNVTSFITLQAESTYPSTFSAWRFAGGSIYSYSNPVNISWNSTTATQIYAS